MGSGVAILLCMYERSWCVYSFVELGGESSPSIHTYYNNLGNFLCQECDIFSFMISVLLHNTSV